MFLQISEDFMNKKEIVEVLGALHKITGFRVSLHGANYEEIAAFPEEKCAFCRLVQRNEEEYRECVKCDSIACKTALETRDTYIYKCRYGLTEAISPLYNFGHLTGFLMMGQTVTSGKEMATTELLFRQKCPNEEVTEAISEIPITQSELVESYIRIMTVCARYLTLSNAFISSRPTLAENAKSYIHDNYGEKLGISELCKHLCCSKSTLVKLFKEECGTTVGAYITDVRLAEAERMLLNGRLSVSEIARETGFCDQSYFSKVFYARHGVTPTDFRSSKSEKASAK